MIFIDFWKIPQMHHRKLHWKTTGPTSCLVLEVRHARAQQFSIDVGTLKLVFKPLVLGGVGKAVGWF